MNSNFNRDWEKLLRPFDRVWERVQGERPGRPLPPPPPMFGPPPPPPGPFPPPPPPGPFPPPPPPGPFPPPPPPGPFPPRGCCTRAVRFNPHGRRG